MKQLVLNIPESEYRFFMKLIRSFPFVEVDEKKNKLLELEAKLTHRNRKIWGNIKEGLNEVELIEQGKIKAKSAKEFLNEL
jgi:ribosomal protein S4E